MDTFVAKHRETESTPWMSVNWDAWKFENKEKKGVGASIVDLGITPKEGHDVLHMILSQEEQSQLIVSTTDLEHRINQWVKLKAIHGGQEAVPYSNSFTSQSDFHQSDFTASANQIEHKITAIWKKVLGIEHISIDDDFFELGGSSLTALRLFSDIENVFGKKISLAMLLKAPTIKELANIVKEVDTSSGWNSLVTFKDSGSNPPMFLIHGAEGNILLYRELAHHLGSNQPVYGLQSQGLDGSEIKYTQIEDIASYYISEIKKIQPEGPYHLGGYCMGGVVAYEIAQQLSSQDQQINLLAMFETYNPQKDISLSSPFKRLYYSLQNLFFHIQNFLKLTTRDKFKFFLKKAAVELGRIKVFFAINILRFIKPFSSKDRKKQPTSSIKKFNDQAYYNYKPQPYAGRLTLFKPQRFFSGANDPNFGWNDLARDGMDVFELPVNPRGMLFEPFVQILAQKLSTCISKSMVIKPNTKN
jgi:thioesterase domain-containing protein/acyl carrier protein